MHTLSLSPKVLTWAASNVGMTLGALAEKIARPAKRAEVFEGRLTPNQVQEVAKLSRVPFGYLFMDEPPALHTASIPDLRQVQNPDPLGLAFKETLDDVTAKQDWYVDYLDDIGADRPSIVGKFPMRRDAGLVGRVAADIRQVLGVSPELRSACPTKEDYYSKLAARLEDQGILVFKSGIVRSSTKRPLPVSEFRGFAISHPTAPLIFINGRDSPAAWVFTLMHEAAHIWLGATGVSDISGSTHSTYSGVEQVCNQVAAEVLTPAAEFLERWEKAPSLDHLSRVFKVSRLVVARRALDFGKIKRAEYLEIVAASKAPINAEGGNPYATIPIRNSKSLMNAVLSSAMGGKMMLRDAASLLNVKPATVVELAKRRTREE